MIFITNFACGCPESVLFQMVTPLAEILPYGVIFITNFACGCPESVLFQMMTPLAEILPYGVIFISNLQKNKKIISNLSVRPYLKLANGEKLKRKIKSLPIK